MLEAFSKISARHKNLRLKILGDGPLKFHLKNEAKKLGISEQTKFLGIVYDVQMILEHCDIVVLPSISREGLGMAIIEGMCLAKPVIASNIGGIPELVEDGVNGYLIPPKDPVALAEKLEVLIGNKEMRQIMGAAGKRKFEENFDAATMVKRIEKLYGSILEKKSIRKKQLISV